MFLKKLSGSFLCQGCEFFRLPLNKGHRFPNLALRQLCTEVAAHLLRENGSDFRTDLPFRCPNPRHGHGHNFFREKILSRLITVRQTHLIAQTQQVNPRHRRHGRRFRHGATGNQFAVAGQRLIHYAFGKNIDKGGRTVNFTQINDVVILEPLILKALLDTLVIKTRQRETIREIPFGQRL